MGYGPWDHKESDTSGQLIFHTHFSHSQRENRQTVKSCCPGFLWQVDYEWHARGGILTGQGEARG